MRHPHSSEGAPQDGYYPGDFTSIPFKTARSAHAGPRSDGTFPLVSRMNGCCQESATPFEAAGTAASWWVAAGAKHTRGSDAAPEEYEPRVIAYVDATLLSHP